MTVFLILVLVVLMGLTVFSLVRGVVCGLAEDATGFAGETVSHALPAEFVAALAGAELSPRDGWDAPRGLPYVVLLNEHGDPVTYLVGVAGEIVVCEGARCSAMAAPAMSRGVTEPYSGRPGGTPRPRRSVA